MMTLLDTRLPIDDSTLSIAVASFLALELVNTDSMIINSYFHCWGLGKTDLSQYSEFYQSQIQAINLPSDLVHSPLNDSLNQGGVTLGNESLTNSELYSFCIRIYLLNSRRSWLYNCVAVSKDDAYELAERSTVSVVGRLSIEWQKDYTHVEFKESFAYSDLAQLAIKKIQTNQGLDNSLICTLDDDISLLINYKEFAKYGISEFPSELEQKQFDSEQDLIIPIELPVTDEPLGQAQCWICPHCHDDARHKSDENGCEWQYKQDAIDAKCYRYLRDVVFDKDCLPVDENGKPNIGQLFVFELPPIMTLCNFGLNGVDLDQAIDKAMAVQCKQTDHSWMTQFEIVKGD
jgi:hypothetical protein